MTGLLLSGWLAIRHFVGYSFWGSLDDDNGHMIECIAAARWRLLFASS
jgi:hypothetical protein